MVTEDKVDYLIDSSQVYSDGSEEDSVFYNPDNNFVVNDDDNYLELNFDNGNLFMHNLFDINETI